MKDTPMTLEQAQELLAERKRIMGMQERYVNAWTEHAMQLHRLAESSDQIAMVQAMGKEIILTATTNAKRLYPVPRGVQYIHAIRLVKQAEQAQAEAESDKQPQDAESLEHNVNDSVQGMGGCE